MTAQAAHADLRHLDLRFARRGERSVLDRRIFSWPFVITRTFALDPAMPHQQSVILQTASSAMHGVDHLRQRLHLGTGAAAEILTQGAGAVHRANPGDTTRETIEIGLGPDCWLDYLPQPRILFPGAAICQTIDVEFAPSSIAFLADGFTLHDPEAAGRLFRRFESTTTLRRSGEPIVIDRYDIAGDARHFASYSAHGSLLILAPRPAELLQAWSLELSASLAATQGLYAAASVLPGAIGIGLRFAATQLRHFRAASLLARNLIRPRLL